MGKCPFAHTLQELEQGQRVEKMSMCLLCPSTEESVRAQTKPAVKKQNKKKKLKSTYKFCLHACENVYNKRTQTWNEAGHDACPYKETCKFAHSAFEHRFGTALEARMNPEDELGDLTEEVAECEPLPMPQFPLTITRTDSQGSTTKINGGTVGFMCLEHTDGTLGYLPQSPIVDVPLCSALTSLESLSSLRSTSSEISASDDQDEQSDSGVSFSSLEAYSRAPSVEPEPIVPATNSRSRTLSSHNTAAAAVLATNAATNGAVRTTRTMHTRTISRANVCHSCILSENSTRNASPTQ